MSIEQVVAHLNAEGYPVGEFIPDGKIHRFRMDDADTRKSGWYIGYKNFLQSNGDEYFVVTFGSWADAATHKFNTRAGDLTPADAKLQKEQFKKAREQTEKERDAAYEQVSQECIKKFNSLASSGKSPYLERKQIADCKALRVGFDTNGDIYVPIEDIDGKLWSLEQIRADGSKKSYPGGRRQSYFHIVGESVISDKIFIAEGFATAVSIYMATGRTSVCSFGSSSLKTVALILRKAIPDVEIIICGDIDKKENSGSKKMATDAAMAIASRAIFPSFKSLESKPSDFNDLHCLEGIDEVKRQLLEPTEVALVQLSRGEIVEAPYPDEDESGRRPGTIENVSELIRRLGITARYNVIAKAVDYRIPGESFLLHNQENNCLTIIKSWMNRCNINKGDLCPILDVVADRNPYNPVVTWIESEPWDGKSRLKEFFDTVDAVDNPLKEKLMKRWLISAVAAAYLSDGVSAHGVLVFQGTQYLGKTKWFKSLVPAELSSLLKDGVTLKPDDKDSVFQAIQYWIVELGELDATFRKADISQLKSFIPKTIDVQRRPFAEKDSRYPRQTVFFASVNDTEFLVDESGNRRFWTIECVKINAHHTIDMQQLWAEVAVLYKAGESWLLTDQENAQLNQHNKTFESVNPIEELIEEYYGWGLPASQVVNVHVNATQVCIAVGKLNPTKLDRNAAARAIRKISGGMMKPDSRRKYWLPLRRSM